MNTTFVLPQALPPTLAAVKYHSFRICFQIQKWKDNTSEIQPTARGWKDCDEKLLPVLTNLPPVPDEFLKITRCNCHTDCNSMRYTCKKYNMNALLLLGTVREQAVLIATQVRG